MPKKRRKLDVFCQNPECGCYNKQGLKNIVRNGKSKTFLRKFEGQCSSPPITLNCPPSQYLEFVSGVEPTWNDPLYHPRLRSLLQSKSGALYVGGFKYISIPSTGGDLYYPSYNWVPIVYKSLDNGKNWVGVQLPYDTSFGFAYVGYVKLPGLNVRSLFSTSPA